MSSFKVDSNIPPKCNSGNTIFSQGPHTANPQTERIIEPVITPSSPLLISEKSRHRKCKSKSIWSTGDDKLGQFVSVIDFKVHKKLIFFLILYW
jgi:hypothetical protein